MPALDHAKIQGDLLPINPPLEQFIPDRDTPLTQKLLESFTTRLHPAHLKLAQQSIFTTRQPGNVEESTKQLLPNTESMREQIHALCEDESGTFSNEKFDELITRIDEYGYIFYADGNKIQTVSDDVDPRTGDAYIAGNLEVLLQAAQALDCDLIFGIYSGDENTGILIPRVKKGQVTALTQETIYSTIQAQSDSYYRSNNPTSKFFLSAQAAIDAKEFKDQPQIGLKIKAKAVKDTKIHLSREQITRERGFASGIMDATTNKHINDNTTTITQAIKDIYQGKRIVGQDNSRYKNPIFPPNIYQLYLESVHDIVSSELSGEYRQDMTLPQLIELGKKNTHIDELIRQATAYAELSTYEPLYPGSLEVRKIACFEQDISQNIANGEDTYLVRFADTRMKSVNEFSHTLGDNHLIGTMRLVQQVLSNHGIADVHDKIKYYQHFGSFMITTTDQSLATRINEILENSFELNKEIYSINQTRELESQVEDYTQDSEYRAKPFVVATTKLKSPSTNEFENIVFSKDSKPQDIWKLVEEMRSAQQGNETRVTLVASGYANNLPAEYIKFLNQIISTYELGQVPSDELWEQMLLDSMLVDLFAEYSLQRENRLPIALESLRNANNEATTPHHLSVLYALSTNAYYSKFNDV